MVVIGITGNIGSGKSTVCQILARLGATVIDADKLAHEAYKLHSQAWQKIIATFGKDIVKPDEEIDRQKLGQIVFSNSDALTQLNQIVHPKAYHIAQERIQNYHLQGAKAIALEATLLIEARWTNLVSKVWLVVASETTVVQRLKEQGIDEFHILARLKSQMPVEEKMKYADAVIYNDGDITQLEARITALWQALHII